MSIQEHLLILFINLRSGALMDNKKNKGKVENNGGNTLNNYFNLKKITNTNTNGKPAETRPRPDKPRQQPKSRKPSEYNDSSREARQASDHGTQILISSGDQGKNPENKICKQLIMIGPCDVNYFTSLKLKIDKALADYSKQKVLQMVQDNTKMINRKIENINNLRKINDDEFWSRTVPIMLDYASNEAYQKSISAKIEVMTQQSTGNPGKVLLLSKSQILMMLINMFLGTFPKQTYRSSPLFFGQLYATRASESQTSASVRLQKLKCLVNYFKIITKRSFTDLENRFITLRRGSSQDKISKEELAQIEYNLSMVDFKQGLIEDQENKGAMVDFANKNLGGGVLSNGAVQEEILFVCYPELMCTMCISEELGYYEALLIEGVQRFSYYEGYSDSFKFLAQKQKKHEETGRRTRRNVMAEQESQTQVLCPTIFIAVDATNFSVQIMKEKGQFLPETIDKEIYKFMAGADLLNQQGIASYIRVVTGRWGCGAFRGDPYIKFIIQWIACSIMGRQMLYVSTQRGQREELETMYNFLRRYNTKQLRELISEYHDCARNKNGPSFLHYLKEMS